MVLPLQAASAHPGTSSTFWRHPDPVPRLTYAQATDRDRTSLAGGRREGLKCLRRRGGSPSTRNGKECQCHREWPEMARDGRRSKNQTRSRRSVFLKPQWCSLWHCHVSYVRKPKTKQMRQAVGAFNLRHAAG